MPYETDMKEEEGAKEGGEKKEYTHEEMMEYIINEVKTVEQFQAALEEHGWSLTGPEEGEEEEEGPPTDHESIEKELGMNVRPTKMAVIRISSARKALNQARRK